MFENCKFITKPTTHSHSPSLSIWCIRAERVLIKSVTMCDTFLENWCHFSNSLHLKSHQQKKCNANFSFSKCFFYLFCSRSLNIWVSLQQRKAIVTSLPLCWQLWELLLHWQWKLLVWLHTRRWWSVQLHWPLPVSLHWKRSIQAIITMRRHSMWHRAIIDVPLT